jgi:hypothetical protein
VAGIHQIAEISSDFPNFCQAIGPDGLNRLIIIVLLILWLWGGETISELQYACV